MLNTSCAKIGFAGYIQLRRDCMNGLACRCGCASKIWLRIKFTRQLYGLIVWRYRCSICRDRVRTSCGEWMVAILSTHLVSRIRSSHIDETMGSGFYSSLKSSLASTAGVANFTTWLRDAKPDCFVVPLERIQVSLLRMQRRLLLS